MLSGFTERWQNTTCRCRGFLAQQLGCQTKLGKVSAKPRKTVFYFKCRHHPHHAILRQGKRASHYRGLKKKKKALSVLCRQHFLNNHSVASFSGLIACFSCLIALARTTCTLLITSWDRRYTSLIPESEVIIMKISSLSIMVVESTEALYQVEKVPFYVKFAVNFYHE